MKSNMIKIVRVSHPNTQGEPCHMFDVNFDHFNLWKAGGIGLSADACMLPNGKPPTPLAPFQCGTCLTTKFNRSDLIFETISKA